MEDLRVFHGSFKQVSRKLQEDSRKFQVSRVLQESLKGVSRGIEGCFERALRVFQESFIGISKKFKWCFKVLPSVFQGSFKDV